ncbi:hypothetical protein COCMIDRAFT_111203 [Bipolaris oryzae ATCC 44560]|uniref:Uncharacterized protein n=1 Tax=Bipolaris oryzae ATCC 44560 TaxID=930090 RepID=W6Z7A3_COCMI|nr:uncharacterized protein COCMIDRAFT_111203 [Bipolaris oryzae ATCC 44560]EUC39566.1 hypothetical protein COCMIDRAFT_111203 [Bipolaris oryzae ATCC 44560]
MRHWISGTPRDTNQDSEYRPCSPNATVQPMQHQPPYQNIHPSFSTRDISTTMTAIEEAIAAINSQDVEGQLSYRAAIKKFSVKLIILTRRH